MAQPRRTPQQARSRETVVTILVAATRVLLQHGPGRLSTNRIAKVAGVSVGSLYQYFSDKRGLLAELAARRVEVMTVEFKCRVRRASDVGEQCAAVADVAWAMARLEHLLCPLVPGHTPAVEASCRQLLVSCLAAIFRDDPERARLVGASMAAQLELITRGAAHPGDEALSHELRQRLAELALEPDIQSGIHSRPLARAG
ncbi:MAG: TetR/AcrR family transcriptional regulator [Polyangiaceae bacterium]|nr:TetR/AcrR family transcriptional regulator [Polyangiaceae bacterium]MCW5791583.1 TetR/AcrR family transcriptional regulator [Polyangiaceae bacterium]